MHPLILTQLTRNLRSVQSSLSRNLLYYIIKSSSGGNPAYPGTLFPSQISYYSTRLPSPARVTLIPDSPMHLQFFFSLFSLHPTATKKKWRNYCLLEAIMALLVKSFAILCVHAPSVKSCTPGTHCGSNWAFSLKWPASIQIDWNK